MRTLQRIGFVAMLAGLSVTAGAKRMYSDAPSGAFGVASARAERGYFSQMPFESVDMVTGNLTLTFTDLVLPGNAGMDLRFKRTYSHQAASANHWTFSFVGAPIAAYIPSTGDPALMNADWSQESLHDNVVSGYWVTTGFARWAASTRTLYLPNGWIATYSAPTGSSEYAWLHEVHDAYGNSITPSWDTSSGPARLASVTQHVDDGDATHTRTVSFEYGSPVTPISMTYGDRVWHYYYGSSGLTSAQPPGGGPDWEYSYASNALTVTTPNGGTVAYSFTDHNDRSTVHSITTGGRAIYSGTWGFDYSESGSTATTTVTTPSRTMTYEHSWSDDGPDGKQWVLTDRTLLNGSTPVQHVHRDYHGTGFGTGKVVKALAAQDITQDGVTLTTAYHYSGSNYDDYVQPDTITESASNHSATRVTGRTFHYFSSGYILPRVSGATVTMGSESYSTSVEYDTTGFVTSRTAGGITTAYGRDDYGNPNSATDPMNHSTWTDFRWGVPKNAGNAEYAIYRNVNEDGTLANEWRGWAGPVTYYEYDALGRITSVALPEGASITTTYASDGSAVTVTRGSSSVVTTVDGFGRPIATENAEGVKTSTTYDNEGRKTFQSAPFTGSSGTGNTFEYDPLGRVSLVRHADDSTVTYSYSGTDVTITDENSHATTQHRQVFGSPGNGRLASVTDADGHDWVYSYNVYGSLTSVAGPSGPGRTWTYNSNNQLTSETQPESGTTTYSYNSDGLLASKTDPLDHTTSFTYDGVHRLITINAPGTSDDTSLTYDARDNRLTTSMSASATTFSYDGANRPQSRTDTIDGHTFTTAFEYDGRDNLTKITYPSGRQIQYAYDYANRITQVYSGSTIYAGDLAYHPTGALTAASFGNGTSETLTLNSRFRPYHLTSGPLDVIYTYDAAGNVAGIEDARSEYDASYCYDALDRLTKLSGCDGPVTYSYDAQGNRLTKGTGSSAVTYTYSSTTNRLTSATSSLGVPETGTFTYDANGSMTGDGTGTYTYSGRNQMASSTVSSATTNYTYDADGMRAIKATPSKTTYYVHGLGPLVLAEYTPTDGAPSLDKEYVYLGSQLLAALTPSEDGDTPVAAVTSVTLSASSITAGGSVTATVLGESLACPQVKITWGDGSSASYPLSSPYALPIAETHTYSTAGLYTIVAEGESGCGGKVSIAIEVRSTQVVTNGDFSGGLNETSTAPAGWQLYSDGSIAWAATPLFAFYRATDSTYGVLLQDQTVSWPTGAPLEATFKLGNTDTVGRQVHVAIHNADWSDFAGCTYYLPASQSPTTYTMRLHTTMSWSAAGIDFYFLDASTTPYQLDDVSLVYAPANSSAKTDCVDPNVPTSGGSTSSTLVSNGDFSSGTSSWTLSSTLQNSVSSGVLNFYGASSAPSPWPTIAQGLGSVSANQRLAAVFDLGNSSATRQRVDVYLQGATSTSCSFYLPAGSPLRTFALLSYAPVSWSSATLMISFAELGTESTHGWLHLDNVAISKVTTSIVGTSCLEPGSFTESSAPVPLPSSVALTAHVEAPAKPAMRTTVFPVHDMTPAMDAALATSASSVDMPDGGTPATIPPAATWTMTLQGSGTGTVTSSPGGISCGGRDISCNGLFVENTSITFTATPKSGESFGGWGGACSGVSATCIVSGVGDQTVYATFNGPSTIAYYHMDALGSVRAITDGSGSAVKRIDYLPFGETSASLTGDPKKYLGQDQDAETAFDYFGARYYRNVWGRFTSVDPIVSAAAQMNPQLWNRYAYALNSPLRYSDSGGMEPQEGKSTSGPIEDEYGGSNCTFSCRSLDDEVEFYFNASTTLDFKTWNDQGRKSVAAAEADARERAAVLAEILKVPGLWGAMSSIATPTWVPASGRQPGHFTGKTQVGAIDDVLWNNNHFFSGFPAVGEGLTTPFEFREKNGFFAFGGSLHIVVSDSTGDFHAHVDNVNPLYEPVHALLHLIFDVLPNKSR